MPKDNLIRLGVRTIQEQGRLAIGKKKMNELKLKKDDVLIVYFEKVE